METRKRRIGTLRTVLVVWSALSFAGCSETSESASNSSATLSGHNGGLYRKRNEGYSLLYQLMTDESDVSQIFLIKHADESVGSLVKEIATTCRAAKKQMDEFPKKDSRIEYDVPDLPDLEQQGRDLERKWETRILLTSSGKEFETQLVFSQAEAMAYAANMCSAILKYEDDPSRNGFLTDLAKKCESFRDRLLGMLTVKS